MVEGRGQPEVVSCKRGNDDATIKDEQREELETMFRVTSRLFPPTPCSTQTNIPGDVFQTRLASRPLLEGYRCCNRGDITPNGQNVRLGLSGPAREHPGKAGCEGLGLELLFGI